MPESSIVFKSEDRYSSTVKAMATVTKSFSKDNEALEKQLQQLSRKKWSIKMDLDQAKKALKDLEKQFERTGDAADMDALEKAQKRLDDIQRNYSLVSRAAGEATRQMERNAEAIRRTGNGSSGGGGFATVISALAAAGAGQMIGQLAQQGANTMVTSAMGSAGGTVFSSALSSAISGAAIGSIIPGIGTAAGAAIGAGVGALSGGLQVFEKQDDAFKSYVQEAVEGQLSQRDSDIASGSSIASQREKDLISFSALFGNRRTAERYLAGLVDMANTTPFLYGDLTAMSKTLGTYGYGANSILPVLQTIGDAGAALGMTTGDMSMVATALGRMKSSDKTTLEYLNILNDRGIGAVGMLSSAYGVDQGTMYDMISKGQVKGTEAVDIILNALTEKFSGSMVEQSKTFAGKTSTLQGMEQEMQNAYGEGYNAERTKGLQAQIDWFSGASGEAQEEANKAIGAWQASLENAKEKYIRDAINYTLTEDENYQKAKAEGDAAEMGRLIMEAKVRGQNEYNANEGREEALKSELSMIQSVREDTALKSEYWDAGYTMGQEYTKGRAAALASGIGVTGEDTRRMAALYSPEVLGYDPSLLGYAYGLRRVPYDNFPALLHEGERVLTASEARSDERGGKISVTIGNVTFGESVSDPKQAAGLFAGELVRQIMLAVPE